MHYTNLNGCNSRMLWNIDLSLVADSADYYWSKSTSKIKVL